MAEEPIDLNDDVTVPALALHVMAQLQQDSNYTLFQLIASYKHSLAKERAASQLIEARIAALCSGPYAPNPIAILGAFDLKYSLEVEHLAALLEKEL